MLATLFKDERCSQLPTHSILEKMYLDQVIRRKDLAEFEAVLMDHQKATTADGGTIGHVNEYPTMQYFGIPRHAQSLIAYKMLTEYF